MGWAAGASSKAGQVLGRQPALGTCWESNESISYVDDAIRSQDVWQDDARAAHNRLACWATEAWAGREGWPCAAVCR